jgi:hypothetical protein
MLRTQAQIIKVSSDLLLYIIKGLKWRKAWSKSRSDDKKAVKS